MKENRYTHGGDIYRNKVKYDFSVNINPLGMPKRSIEAGKRAVELSQRYPDYMGEELCRELSEREECDAKNIVIGNGAAGLIYALCQSVRPKNALIPSPTFTEYERAVRASGGAVTKLYADERKEFEVSADEVIAEIYVHDKGELDMLFLCNPNNPTGKLLSGDVRRIAEACGERGILLVVDECFLPFCDGEEAYTMKHDLEQSERMCVLRAFTKIYAMPGLRLGYLLTADKRLIQGINGMTQPWNTSLPAQMAGCAALKEKEYLAETHRLIHAEREYLSRELSSFDGVHVYESDANFILFRTKNRSALYDELLDRGILIRRCDDFDGLGFDSETQYYRVAVRTHSENEELVRAMKEVF